MNEKKQHIHSKVSLQKGWEETGNPWLGVKFLPMLASFYLFTDLLQSFVLRWVNQQPHQQLFFLFQVKHAAAASSRLIPNLPLSLAVPMLQVWKYMLTGRKWDWTTEVNGGPPAYTIRHTLPKLKEAVPQCPLHSKVPHPYLTTWLHSQKPKEQVQRAATVSPLEPQYVNPSISRKNVKYLHAAPEWSK